MLLKISKRCFSKVVVAAMFDSRNPKLSETEKDNMVGLLQLMESAYKPDIWDNMGVVTIQSKGEMKLNQTFFNLTLPNQAFTNITLPNLA
jgi:hypothetical protein